MRVVLVGGVEFGGDCSNWRSSYLYRVHFRYLISPVFNR